MATPTDNRPSTLHPVAGFLAADWSCHPRDYVEHFDIGDAFLAADDPLPESIMRDRLHPNAEGYRLWADAIAEPIERLLGE